MTHQVPTSTFRSQIAEDIVHIKNDFSDNLPNLATNEYAFNFWVLTKLFSMDEDIAGSYITELSDRGVDCWCYFEEAKELFLIQNKYYTSSSVSYSSLLTEFLSQPLAHLSQGNYKKSPELQSIFSKHKGDEEFKIHLYLYTTQNTIDENFRSKFDSYVFSASDVKAYVDARVFFIDDIRDEFYGERYQDATKFDCKISTINSGTVLNIDPESYRLPSLNKARFILTPVIQLYEIVKDAKSKGYQLFEENIREYLGGKGINTGIINTLKDSTERDNFFFYNNGVTIICETFSNGRNKSETILQNPQIVNGCQSVNSIFDVIDKVPQSEIDDFNTTYVMVKVLEVNKSLNPNLYLDIVRYNNSQNAIKEKDFTANNKVFLNLKTELEKRGLSLFVKQSDKNSFNSNANLRSALRGRVTKLFSLHGIDEIKDSDLGVDLEKLLQVLLAFKKGAREAWQKKSQILKNKSEIFLELLDIIKNSILTVDQIILVYFLFLRAEKERKVSDDGRTPVPYLVVAFIGRDYWNSSCKSLLFDDKGWNTIYSFYKRIANRYRRQLETEGIAYNEMTKLVTEVTKVEGIIKGELDDLEPEAKQIVIEFRCHS